MYAQLVYGYGKKEDLLICLSTSGNSKNCVNAARVAKAIGVNVVSITGEKESKSGCKETGGAGGCFAGEEKKGCCRGQGGVKMRNA